MTKRRVIKNAKNRHTLNQMSLRYNLFMLQNDLIKLMQGHMLGTKHLETMSNNVNVALEKLAKKAKISLNEEESEEK